MSGQATGWVLRHGPKDRALRLVLVAIADAANRDGEESHPGMDAICEGALYSAGHVRRAIARLVDEGWLEVTEHAAPGRATSYRIPGVRAQIAAENAAHNARRPEDDAARSGEPTSRVFEPTSRAQTRAPTVLRDGKTNGSDTPMVPTLDLDPVPTFADFWAVFPRHEAKGTAERAWTGACKSADPRFILDGAQRYRDDPNRDPAYTKHPSTWLNGRCWEDDALPPRRSQRPTQFEDNRRRLTEAMERDR
jgi:hypothetical protein